MKNIYSTLILMLIAFNSFSQTLVEPEPVLWKELKVVQSKVINKMTEDLQLSPQCFQDMNSYKGLFKQRYLQTILWHTYVWDKYRLSDGLYCYVMIENIGQEDQKNIVLSADESKVLVSASLNLGFEEAGYNDYATKINKYNSVILNEYREQNKRKILESTPMILDSTDNIFITDEDTTVVLPQQNHGNFISFNKSTSYENKNRQGISHKQSFNFPYNNVALTEVTKGLCEPEGATAFLISAKVSLTNAHVLGTECGYAIKAFQKLSAHVDDGYLTSHYPNMKAVNIKLPPTWDITQEPIPGNPDDYGVMRFNYGYIYTSNIPLTIIPNIDNYDSISIVGYPSQKVSNNLGMWRYPGTIPSIPPNGIFLWPSQVAIDFSPSLVYGGQSGSPAFKSPSGEAFGMLAYKNAIGNIPSEIGIINGFTETQLAYIYSWMSWNPTVTLDITNNPLNGGSYNLTNIPPFRVITNPINKMKLNGTIVDRGKNLDELVEWESSIDGNFANGSTVSSDQLKVNLSGGVHFITTKIDSNGEQGEASVYIEIIRPTGSFTSSDFCIVDLTNASNNTCPITIAWSVTDTPETSVVWNATTNSLFSSGNTGSKSFTANTSNTKFELYPSNQRKILLDTANVSAKLPTGNLTKNTSVCSLQPSPIDPNTGQLRDAKATPPGCGVQLSWSNVQWASPSIFYKLVGGKTWQQLYQIPCQLNGEVCSGSINTDDILPELIPVNGVEFKLLQFNNANSGVLTTPFTITAHRFADAYELDDGFYAGLPSSTPSDYEIGYSMSNVVTLGVVQNNHSFHRPAAYDSGVDVDTLQVPVTFSGTGSEYEEGNLLSVTVSNMANGLDVGIDVQCSGFQRRPSIDVPPNEGDPIGYEIDEGVLDFFDSPILSTEVNTAAGTKTMTFTLTKNQTQTTNGFTDKLRCIYNRIILTRLSGTPSENLTYSVVVNNQAGFTVDQYDNVPSQRAYDDDVKGQSVFWLGGDTEHLHNFHDVGDTDWTISFTSGNIRFRTELIGSKAETKMSVYKWISAEANPNGDGSFVNVVDQLLASDNSVGGSEIVLQNAKSGVYAVKVESRNGASGSGTDYKLIIDTPPGITPDQYDNVPSQRAYDDDIKGQSVFWLGGDTEHLHNLHDVGDTDWTISFTSGNIRFRTELIGSKAETKMSVYKWISAEANPNGDGSFLNVVDQLLASDNSAGGSEIVLQNAESGVYAVKVESRNGASGIGTDYKLIIDSPPNIPPVASFTYNCNYLSCSFNASSSLDNDGFISNYNWSFGGNGVNVSKTFSQAGNHSVVLTVTDNNGVSSSITKNVFVFSSISPDQYDNVPSQRAYDDDVKGQSVFWLGGDTEHLHNFHDSGDVDWTITYMTGTRTISTQLLGDRATTNISVYKWLSATADPNGNGTFTNVSDTLIGTDNIGNSSITVSASVGTVFAVKVTSRYGYYGSGTEYKLKIQ